MNVMHWLVLGECNAVGVNGIMLGELGNGNFRFNSVHFQMIIIRRLITRTAKFMTVI